MTLDAHRAELERRGASSAEGFAELLAAHTSRRPKPRGRGPWWGGCCPAHRDRRESLAFRDGDRALVVRCHAGCRLEEVVAALGIAVGDLFHVPRVAEPRPRRLSPREAARAAILREVGRQPWARPEVLATYQAADLIRARYQTADRLRRAATAAGPTDAAWNDLERAAHLERQAHVAEATLDEVLS